MFELVIVYWRWRWRWRWRFMVRARPRAAFLFLCILALIILLAPPWRWRWRWRLDIGILYIIHRKKNHLLEKSGIRRYAFGSTFSKGGLFLPNSIRRRPPHFIALLNIIHRPKYF
jgi:hypothetical protein